MQCKLLFLSKTPKVTSTLNIKQHKNNRKIMHLNDASHNDGRQLG